MSTTKNLEFGFWYLVSLYPMDRAPDSKVVSQINVLSEKRQDMFWREIQISLFFSRESQYLNNYYRAYLWDFFVVSPNTKCKEKTIF